MICKICKNKTNARNIITRSKSTRRIFFCKNCDFEFFNFDPKKNLKQNKLDITRLKKTGLNIPKLKDDFKNGRNQAKKYIKDFIKSKKKLKILDIGCSWGYFLYELKKQHDVYGLELNTLKKEYVNNKLKIQCENNIENYIHNGNKFDYIFLFYTIEYIPNYEEFLSKCYSILNNSGNIIILTPNKNDLLRTLLDKEKKYMNFFYDDNSINYFSPKSLKKIMKKMKFKRFSINNSQGYSIFNFLNWFFHKKPFPSNKVGGDSLALDLNIYFSKNLYKDVNLKHISSNLLKIFKTMNKQYLHLVNKTEIANIITLKITKN